MVLLYSGSKRNRRSGAAVASASMVAIKQWGIAVQDGAAEITVGFVTSMSAQVSSLGIP